MTEVDKTRAEAKALASVVMAIIKAVESAGTMGAPAGPMYAALMAQGCSLEQFERLMALAVGIGRVRKGVGNLYYAVEQVA